MKNLLIILTMLLTFTVAFSPPEVEAQGNVPTVDADLDVLVQWAETNTSSTVNADIINLVQRNGFDKPGKTYQAGANYSDSYFAPRINWQEVNYWLDRHRYRCDQNYTRPVIVAPINTAGYSSNYYWRLL